MEEKEKDGPRSRGKKRERTGVEQHVHFPCTREGLFPEEQLPSPMGRCTVSNKKDVLTTDREGFTLKPFRSLGQTSTF